jgi:hypothetical protein
VSAIDRYRKTKELVEEFRRDMEREKDYLYVNLESSYTGYHPERWLTDVFSDVTREHRETLLAETLAKMDEIVEKLREEAEAEAREFMEGKK